jgi:hypothetical protein
MHFNERLFQFNPNAIEFKLIANRDRLQIKAKKMISHSYN